MTNTQKPKRSWLLHLRDDVAMVSGLGLLTYGAWLAWSPAGFIVPGVLLLVAGVFGARQ